MNALLKNEKTVKIIVFIGFALIALIFISDIFSDASVSKKNSAEKPVYEEYEDYEKRLEKKLCDAVSEIEGVGKLTVVITLDSLSENVYSDKGGAVRTVITPKVRGAAIICEGGGNIVVKEKVVELASKVLGVSTARICVTN